MRQGWVSMAALAPKVLRDNLNQGRFWIRKIVAASINLSGEVSLPRHTVSKDPRSPGDSPRPGLLL